MRTYTLLLPDPVGRLLEGEAATNRVDPASLCATILSEHFLASQNQSAGSAAKTSNVPDGNSAVFDVRSNFPGLPLRSVEFAQAVVNASLKLPGVRVFRSNRGIGVEPNFVFIEYLHERAPGGIMLSLYGGQERHRNPLIKAGRTGSYSRALVRTQSELQSVLPHVRKAFDLRFR